MKKILLFLVALVATLGMNAQTTEIHNASGKVAAYLGADVKVNFGVATDGATPTIKVYKGDDLMATYEGSDYKVVSTPVEETFKAVYNKKNDANTLTFYYDAVDHSGDSITVYEDGTTNFLFDDKQVFGIKWGYHAIRKEVKSVVIDATVANYSSLTSTVCMFMDMESANSISGAEYLDVSNVTNMRSMFYNYGYGSTSLTAVPDVSKWDTGEVTDMKFMFQNYGYSSTSLIAVPDVSKWNTGEVTEMNYMFQNYGYSSTSLTAVPDVSKWNTGKVTNMIHLFYGYGYSSTSLTAVPDVSGWKTDNVTNITSMFNNYGYYSQNIECELDLSGWNLEKVTSAATVFKFTPKTFSVTIPGKTGNKDNEDGAWYYGSNGGSGSIAPPEGKSFTLFGRGYAAVKSEAGITGNRVKWVQLWKDGPKFAEFNVGVANNKAEDYGGYYAWGGSQDKVDDHNTGSSDLSGDNDTATNLWGSNWHMPTKSDFDALLNNCDVKWTNNYNGTGIVGEIFTGKGDYATNSIFLPAAGKYGTSKVESQGDCGYYWSSTQSNSSAHALGLTSGMQRVFNISRSTIYSVRAVYEPTTGTAKAIIGGVETEVNWIRLWAGGPKFAEHNVGANSAAETGSMMTLQEAAKTGSDYVWGADWYTLSKDDMEELVRAASTEGSTKVKCEVAMQGSTMGFKFTGKESGYTNNSVFFPKTQSSGTTWVVANYWSGTGTTGNRAYYMALKYDNGWNSSLPADSGYTFLVRPALKN